MHIYTYTRIHTHAFVSMFLGYGTRFGATDPGLANETPEVLQNHSSIFLSLSSKTLKNKSSMTRTPQPLSIEFNQYYLELWIQKSWLTL